MKKAVKVLCIISLIIGLIWATVGFFGSWVGGAVSATGKQLANDSQGVASTLNKTADTMIRHIGSFIFVILGGILGIVGSAANSTKMKSLILGILTFTCGCILFSLNNYVAAVRFLLVRAKAVKSKHKLILPEALPAPSS